MTLADLIVAAPFLALDARVGELWASLVQEAALDPACSGLSRHLEREPVKSLLYGIFAGSPYLQGLVLRDKVRLERVLAAVPDDHAEALIARLHGAMSKAGSFADALRELRVFKAEIALLAALADLGGVWHVEQVTRVLSGAADAAVSSAVRFLFGQASEHGDWRPENAGIPEAASGYIVLGMGKYGAYELNYSSDIDLIVFFDAARHRVAPHLEPATFFVRLTRDLVRLMSEQTADGYVFRTDLRLRPDAGATQIALSTVAAHHYYETVGQNWERAAFIKARAVAGDLQAGREVLAALSPFIWRKYLDFDAIADIHAMKRQIHAHRGFGAIATGGHNIKLGPGGIREIEFFVQTQQLIAGGRQSELRSPRTLEALEALVDRGWIAPQVAHELTAAYLTLRKIEHRLQMVADEQTHTVPSKLDELARFSVFAGFGNVAAFSDVLLTTLYAVQGHYAYLFERAPKLTARASNMVFAGEADDPATLEVLGGMGFSQPAQVLSTVRGWHHGRYRAMRSARSRERLTEVQPLLIEALGSSVDPDSALANFDRFLADLPSGVQLFALLRARPGLLQLVADIMGSAPRLARILSRRRRLFDAMIDSNALSAPASSAYYERLLGEAMPEAAEFEAVLDGARIIGSEQQFLIGVRVLSGGMTARDAGEAYAALAQALIGTFHARIHRDMARVHGVFPGDGAVVVAMGKLGGREMTATSDLDLIVIYDVPEAAMTGALLSDGNKPLSAPPYYTRFTQRLVAALSAPTTEGTLYDVDLRLRPSGQKGPLATSLAGFSAYQAKEAWTWEHMALTRARVVSGTNALRAEVSAAIVSVLRIPRDAKKIATDVRDMRARIVAEKGTSGIWDLKQVRGGLVDLEFVAQHLQLIHAAHAPQILEPNTGAALAKIAASGYLSPADAQKLIAAARLFSELTEVLRLLTDGPFDDASAPRGLKDRLIRAAGSASFSALEAELKETEAAVMEAFEQLV